MRLHVSCSAGAVLALAVLSAPTACSKFKATPVSDSDAATIEADGSSNSDAHGGECTTDTCADAGASCRAYDFSGECPPTDWGFSGDGLTECVGGRIHIYANDTKDATATLTHTTPGTLSAARISLHFEIASWDGKTLFDVGMETDSGYIIKARENVAGLMDLQLCRATSCVPLATVPFNVEHVLVLDLSAAGISVSVDCAPPVTQPGTGKAPPPNKDLILAFGHMDGMPPIDGTIHDVVVSFR